MSLFCNVFNCVIAEVAREIVHDLPVIGPEPLDELDDQGILLLPVLAFGSSGEEACKIDAFGSSIDVKEELNISNAPLVASVSSSSSITFSRLSEASWPYFTKVDGSA